MKRSLVHRAAAVVLAAALPGCHIYAAGNDKLAQAVQKDFHDLDLAHSLDEEKKLSRDMLDAELAAAAKYDEAQRDQHLAYLLDDPIFKRAGDAPCASDAAATTGTLACEISTQLESLAGPGDHTALAAYLASREVRAATLRTAAKALSDYLTRKKLEPLALDCTTDNATKLKARVASAAQSANAEEKDLGTVLGEYVGECEKALVVSAPAASSKMGRTFADLEALQSALDEAAARADTLSKAFDAANAEYEAASTKQSKVEETAGKIAAAEEKLKKALDDLDAASKDAAEKLGKLPIAGNPVEVAALGAREKELTHAIRTALDDAEGIYERSQTKAVVKVLVDLEHIDRDKLLPSLMLELEITRGRLEYARSQANQAGEQIAALHDRVDALERAFSSMWTARQNIEGAVRPTAPGKPVCANESAVVAASMTKDDCGRAVARAMLAYANGWTLGLIPAQAAQLRYIGAIDAGALETSASVLVMWERILAVPIDQVAKYHAGGTKPEEVAQIVVQALGFAGLIATTGATAAK